MIKNLLVFVLSLLGWSSLLWFGIRPDFLHLSIPLVIALHLLPPMALWGASCWRQRRKQRQAVEDQQRQDAEAEQQRKAVYHAALEQHRAETSLRRHGCDCRFMAITGLAQTTEQEAPELDNVVWACLAADDAALEQRPRDLLAALREHLADALRELYQQCEAATRFPIYLVPPTGLPAEIWIQLVRELAHPAAPAVSYLPEADSTAQRLIELFKRPDQPGCIVLAFDSPLADQEPPDPDDAPPPRTAYQALYGEPGQAVVALLLTHPELDAMLATLARTGYSQQGDAMTPHWERALPHTEYPLLATIALEQREALADLPVLARLQRAASLQIGEERPSAFGLTRQLRSALEEALINAGQRPLPWNGPAGNDPPPTGQGDVQPAQCTWLIHNAGGHASGGMRLGALSTALHAFEIDLNPIEQACNTVLDYGDLGSCRALFMTALGIIHSARQQGAVLCAEFAFPSQAAVYFVQPLTTQGPT